MALPLLLAAGAGILGGAQYLMKKYDQREANQSLMNLQNQLPRSALDPSTQEQILATAQSLLDNDSFFNRKSVNSQLQQLQNWSLMAHRDSLARHQNSVAAAESAYRTSNQGVLNQVWDQRKAIDQTWGTVQGQGRIIDSLYNQGDLSGNTLMAMVNAVAKLQFPNEALNEADIQRVMSGNPLFVDWMNRIQTAVSGEAYGDLAKEIYETARRIYSAQEQSYRAGSKNLDQFIADSRRQGFLQTNLADRRFGTVSDAYQFGGGGGTAGGGGGLSPYIVRPQTPDQKALLESYGLDPNRWEVQPQ